MLIIISVFNWKFILSLHLVHLGSYMPLLILLIDIVVIWKAGIPRVFFIFCCNYIPSLAKYLHAVIHLLYSL